MRIWFTQRTHISWHITWMAAGILLGVVIAPWMSVFFADGVWLITAVALLLPAIRSRKRWLMCAMMLAGCLIGLWRGAGQQHALQAYAPYYDKHLHIQGVMAEDATYGPKGDQRLLLKQVHIGPTELTGRIWVSVANKVDIKRGDTAFVVGKVSEGFGSIAASLHRARVEHIQRPHPGDVARIIRDWFTSGVRQGVPEPQASLGIGYLTGQRSALPPTLDQQLQIVGLAHAVVASGYNLTILVAFARRFFLNVSKYLAATAAGVMICGFVLVTGLSPSMSRAGLVAGVSLVAWYYGRTVHPFVLLPVAAAITVLVDPSYMWGDLGWYLSFAAFFGITVLAPLLRRYFWGKRRPGLLGSILADTVAAQLMTLPIILGAFGQYAAYALPANVLVAPLIPLAMSLTFLAGVGGLVWPGIAEYIGWSASVLLRYMTWVVDRIASLPGAQIEIDFNVWWMVASYGLLVGLCVFLGQRTGYRFRENDTEK